VWHMRTAGPGTYGSICRPHIICRPPLYIPTSNQPEYWYRALCTVSSPSTPSQLDGAQLRRRDSTAGCLRDVSGLA
jgi:hypothetical protein